MTARRWGLRIATDSRFGAGHVARCHALAAALGDAILYCDPDDRQADGLRQLGYPVLTEAAHDAAYLAQRALQQGEISGLMFDGYDFDAAIRAAIPCGLVGRVDDFDTVEPATAVVLNPNLGGNNADYAGLSAKVAAGPEFALLHAAYEDVAPRDASLSGGLRVLISMGVRDSRNATAAAVEAVRAELPDAAISILLPETAPHYAMLHETLRSQAVSFVAVADAADAIGLYQAHNVCIGAAGVSLLERLACGLPSIVIQQSDNQEKSCRAAERLGVALVVGRVGAAGLQSGLRTAVRHLAHDVAYRQKLSAAGRATVDGQGARRAAKFLQQVLDQSR